MAVTENLPNATRERPIGFGRLKRKEDARFIRGQGLYLDDIRLPGMLYAKILRPPAHGATLVKVDTSEAAQRSGVTIVNQDGLVAVLHADPEAAEAALARIAVKAEWTTPPPGADQDGIFQELLRTAFFVAAGSWCLSSDFCTKASTRMKATIVKITKMATITVLLLETTQ